MMKQVKMKLPLRMLILVLGMFFAATGFAQNITVNGHVEDATGEPIIGATVRVVGQQGGVATDFDGDFSIDAPQGATISVSYIGYETEERTAAADLNIVLKEEAGVSLNEVVVIGYGQVKKSDLTGSVTALKPDSKNKGLVINPQDMLSGKVAGVNVTSASGAPGAGAQIRIRGGSSLNASNDPLIVIDGVPVDNAGAQGLSNFLSIVNPQDIESFNVLKDASATAIYGSRGSNGVIIITTKKGRKGQGVQVSYNGSATASMKTSTRKLLDAAGYKSVVANIYGTDSQQYGLLGNADTDWQDELYRTAISHDHNVSVAGSVGDWLPFRVSIGYTGQQGIMKKSEFDRSSASLNLNPSFLDNHLTLNLNAKGIYAETDYPSWGAISAATRMDPTQSIYDTTEAGRIYGGYYQWKTNGGIADHDPTFDSTFNTNAPGNPVAMNEYRDQHAYSRAFIGSADIDYKIHGFEDLRLHATLGADITKGKENTTIDPRSSEAFAFGSYKWETKLKRNLSLSAYAQYYHDFNDAAKNHFDIMAGYEWQHFWNESFNESHGLYPMTYGFTAEEQALRGQYYNQYKYHGRTENYLVSFFGRANWSLMDRYYLTATLRNDGSSRFKDHWSLFPSFAFAWKMKDENKLRDIDWLSDLKLRLGWGMTGQQDINRDYGYFAVYNMFNNSQAQYPLLPEGTPLYTPSAYDPDIKWETTTTYNVGLDFGFFNQRLTGSVDWYFRKTSDLLNYGYAAAGTNFDNRVWTNIGSLKNTGVEVSLDWKALQTKDWYWTIGYNFTYNKNEITELFGANTRPIEYENTHAATGKMIKAWQVGQPATAFWVYQQAYDVNGHPVNGAIVDRNGDGQITDDDRYYYKQAMAPVTMGLSSRLEYKNWDFGFNLRASIGNYVYDAVEASRYNLHELYYMGFMQNTVASAVELDWRDHLWVQSDYFVHNASFLKMDNITLGYSFSQLMKTGKWHGLSGRIYGTVNNVFTISNYKGIDPELQSGVDYELYPRPISFIVGLNLNF